MENGNANKQFIFGTWGLGGAGWEELSAAKAEEVLDHSWRLGVRRFDSARAYGSAEDRLGAFLKKQQRSEYEVASKVILKGDLEKFKALVNECRKRLGDHLDILFIHWPISDVEIRPTLEWLQEERAAGKIGAIGVSNFTPQQLLEALKVTRIDVFQVGYHLLWRFPEKTILPICVDNGISVQAYSPLGQGILTGKFPLDVNFGIKDHRRKTVLFRPEVWPFMHAAVEKMKALATPFEYSLGDLALKWVLSQRGIDSIVVGARTPAQIESNYGSVKAAIPDDILQELTLISDEASRHIPDTGNFFDNHW